MRRGRFFGGIGLIVLAVIGVLLYLSIFIVDPTQQVLVLRFGNPVRVVLEPGLYYKLPLIDNVVEIDKRVLDLDSPPLEIIARAETLEGTQSTDQQQQQVGQRLVVDAFGRYKIVNPLLFYQAVGTVAVADSRLQVVLNSAVRRVLGDATLFQLVRDQRALLMAKIAQQVDREALAFGVKIVDVKIRRADLPEANSQAVYQRMQTERVQQATGIRAAGEQQARRIRAEADAQVTVLVANANGESERLRGDGEAKRNEIFAAAYSKDPDFFAFYRSMLAYQAGLTSAGTRLVVAPNSEFFRYFNDPSGKILKEGPAGGVSVPSLTAVAPAPVTPPPAPTAPATEPATPAPAQ